MKSSKLMLIVLAAFFATACAVSPDYRVDYDPSADFTAYQTFGFFDQLGTDQAGYSSLVTQHFKNATRREMEKLGYTYTETNPDLLVNFNASSSDKTEVRTRQVPSMGYGMTGYYGYRGMLYSPFPLYETEVETVNYKVGTANIDVVDAERKVLVWEGLVEGRLTKKAMENPRAAIDAVVTELFTRYPTAAGQ
ncbi:DUF4136 domain-containing protein [Thioalkalivibrio sp. XN279]|uniref:DUF4136 domain-containing protein n=1 Tax=Thioalkalivibrio sp. XN279 TaxID=2714953 RepID=UPI001407CEB0|nr:DUF4136 domain-containing protein [Thioalkalivibrio sp. XN279]NHA15334.1 DUF4136 domain-containing protein [Thioalkalivibrio sp. XN279]